MRFFSFFSAWAIALIILPSAKGGEAGDARDYRSCQVISKDGRTAYLTRVFDVPRDTPLADIETAVTSYVREEFHAVLYDVEDDAACLGPYSSYGEAAAGRFESKRRLESLYKLLEFRWAYAGEPVPSAQAAEGAQVGTCVSVSAKKAWQPFSFPAPVSHITAIDGAWTVDAANYRPVGAGGHVGSDGAKLDAFSAYKFDGAQPFGALLVAPDAGSAHLAVNGPAQLGFGPADKLWMRINDTGLGDNDGALRVCLDAPASSAKTTARDDKTGYYYCDVVTLKANYYISAPFTVDGDTPSMVNEFADFVQKTYSETIYDGACMGPFSTEKLAAADVDNIMLGVMGDNLPIKKISWSYSKMPPPSASAATNDDKNRDAAALSKPASPSKAPFFPDPSLSYDELMKLERKCLYAIVNNKDDQNPPGCRCLRSEKRMKKLDPWEADDIGDIVDAQERYAAASEPYKKALDFCFRKR